MEQPEKKLIFVGAGSIATSLGNSLARNRSNHVTMLSIEPEVVKSVNEQHVNNSYFPNQALNPNLKATHDKNILRAADYIFMAIPSVDTVRYLRDNRHLLDKDSVIVNLAKGFGEENKTIFECLSELLPNPVTVLKGPSFARDIMNFQPTSFTFGSADISTYHDMSLLLENTNIYIDHSTDIKGVEILSILKNIYAIIIGIVDAHFDSPNMRFMLLTRAFKEMRKILLHFGGKEDTMFKYCGFGDFNLTALNDLSRNRTLGLLIGKGFFTNDISDKVILEGKIAVNIFCEEICRTGDKYEFPIISELYRVFNDSYDISSFVSRLLSFKEEDTQEG